MEAMEAHLASMGAENAAELVPLLFELIEKEADEAQRLAAVTEQLEQAGVTDPEHGAEEILEEFGRLVVPYGRW
jgi:hypothetical protein